MRTLALLATSLLVRPSPPPVPEPLVDVVVASVVLNPGVKVRADDVRVEARPVSRVPEDAVRVDEIVGQVPRERVLDGEIVRRARLADADLGVGLNAVIPRGMRAIALSLEDPARSGLEAGNIVDLFDAEGEVVLQAVPMLAPPTRGLILAVTPEEAEWLGDAAHGPLTVARRMDVCRSFCVSDDARKWRLAAVEPRPADPVYGGWAANAYAAAVVSSDRVEVACCSAPRLRR